MIATLTTDRLLVGFLVLLFVMWKLIRILIDRLFGEEPPQPETRSHVAFRQSRPYDWEKEPIVHYGVHADPVQRGPFGTS